MEWFNVSLRMCLKEKFVLYIYKNESFTKRKVFEEGNVEHMYSCGHVGTCAVDNAKFGIRNFI